MSIKMAKMAVVASLIVGASSATLAGDNSGKYRVGFIIPGGMNGVDPVQHPDLLSSKAHHLALSRKLSPRVWQNGSQAYGIYPARTRSIGTMTNFASMLCPLLEGYPDCHP